MREERSFLLDKVKTKRIRAVRGEIARLARALGISHARLSNYLHGNRHIPESCLKLLAGELKQEPTTMLTKQSKENLNKVVL